MGNLLTFALAWFYGFVIMTSISIMSGFVFGAWFEKFRKAYTCVGILSFFGGMGNLTYFAWMAVNFQKTTDVMSHSALANAATVVVLTLLYIHCKSRQK